MSVVTALVPILEFLVALTLLVFVHELGHYLVARWNGVRIDTFSIGFGRELAGFTDRAGTRWKLGAVPLGGYVKMFGDMDPAGARTRDGDTLTPAEKAVSFPYKRLWQRAAVVAAGPAANLIFAYVLFAALLMAYGQSATPAVIADVVPGSAAARAGLVAGDRLTGLDGRPVDRFEDVSQFMRVNQGEALDLTLDRGGKPVALHVIPDVVESTDVFGNQYRHGQLGIQASGEGIRYVRINPLTALGEAGRETAGMIGGTLIEVGKMVTGAGGAGELQGPIGMGKAFTKVGESGIGPIIGFVAVLSINLGLLNLFPIPILDGGHLLFYAFEALLGRPLGSRTQEYGFRIGLALVLTLMFVATWNDLGHIGLFNAFRGLFSSMASKLGGHFGG